jgi:hypothetical protein
MMHSNDAKNNDRPISFFRPHTSDKEPKKSMLTASVMVVNERDKLANAGDIPNSLENSGKIACVQYKIENVLKPAAKSATFVLRKADVPITV